MNPPNTISEWQKIVHDNAKDKGWWDEPRAVFESLLLIAGEVFEAAEEYRNGREPSDTYSNPKEPSKPEGIPTELADVVLRILDFCGHYEIDLEAVMWAKHKYNLTRPYKHGGKRL